MNDPAAPARRRHIRIRTVRVFVQVWISTECRLLIARGCVLVEPLQLLKLGLTRRRTGYLDSIASLSISPIPSGSACTPGQEPALI